MTEVDYNHDIDAYTQCAPTLACYNVVEIVLEDDKFFLPALTVPVDPE